MTDYRSELQAHVDACESFAVPVRGQRIPWQTALDRARAALAEPEPKVPTDDELELLVIAIQALHDPSTDGHDLSSVDRGRELLRSAIARWATS